MPTLPDLPDPVDTIERFAELSALLADPFADRDEILRATGLDLASWERIERRWMAALMAGTTAEDLATRFGKAYRDTRARITAGDPLVPSTLPTGAEPRSTPSVAAPPPSPCPDPLALAVPDHVPAPVITIAETLESPVGLPMPPLPFRNPAPAQVRILDPGASPGETLELGTFLPVAPLPFTPKR